MDERSRSEGKAWRSNHLTRPVIQAGLQRNIFGMIVKGLAGLLVGIGYGIFVGALIFLIIRFTSDPGPMIPDNNGWGQMVLTYATFTAGVCGALVGLVVGLSGANKVRGGIIGSVIGLLVLLYLSRDSWTGGTKLSSTQWQELFGISVLLLLFMPIGLGLTGIVVSIIVGKSKS